MTALEFEPEYIIDAITDGKSENDSYEFECEDVQVVQKLERGYLKRAIIRAKGKPYGEVLFIRTPIFVSTNYASEYSTDVFWDDKIMCDRMQKEVSYTVLA